MQQQARDLIKWMEANYTIQADTRTAPDHGTWPTILAILIGAYFVIRALS